MNTKRTDLIKRYIQLTGVTILITAFVLVMGRLSVSVETGRTDVNQPPTSCIESVEQPRTYEETISDYRFVF